MFHAPGLFIICPVFLCSWPVADVQVPSKALPAPHAPGKSLPAIQVSPRVTRSWSAQGVKTVVLRAAAADKAEIVTEGGDRSVTVSGVPVGGAPGYHPTDPNWKETPASQWGLDFQAKAFGPMLVISTSREICYIHHDYRLDRIRISVPEGVKVVKENRKLTGQPTPDLTPDLSEPAP
jgi:hypothetical protein